MKQAGGAVVAIGADSPEEALTLRSQLKLHFPLLADPQARVIEAFGVRHAGGGPGGSDIAAPAHFLVDREGRIAWRFIAHRQQERPGNAADLAAIDSLSGSPAP